jgi:DNA repair exonuclease SbcCD ATPase subunit
MVADIERAEKELEFANRKIKQLDSVTSKLRVENEQLKGAKRGLSEDLQKLMSKRQDIESLQTTLMGIMSQSGNKKIDVEELKAKLVQGVKKDKYHQPFSMDNGITLKKEKRSSSKGINNDLYNGDSSSNAATVKMTAERDVD